jgi:hypothetical protein
MEKLQVFNDGIFPSTVPLLFMKLPRRIWWETGTNIITKYWRKIR